MNAAAQPRTGADPFALPGWWDEGQRAFASLRAVNALRLQILRRWQQDWFPSGGLARCLDAGAGAGFMALPLSQDGIRVLAVDRCWSALREGRQRCDEVAFVRGDLASLPAAAGAFDLALLCDVLEHVDQPWQVLRDVAACLRPGGALFVNTINRTLRARALAVWLGEGLGFIPRGTHDARRFVRPQELEAWAASAGLSRTHACGERPQVLETVRRRAVAVVESRDLSVGYSMGFVRRP